MFLRIIMKNFLLFYIFLIQLEIYATSYEVKMLNQGAEGVMVFEPAYLEINPGDSVTFKASDPAHNSASIPGMIPQNAQTWDSGLSRDLTVTFNEPGIYAYQCTPHVMMAMVGIIQVGNNISNLDNIKSMAEKFKSSFVMNQSRLDNYISKIN